MRFITSATLLTTLLALASAIAVDSAEPVGVRDLTYEGKLADEASSEKRDVDAVLEKRLTKCPDRNGCKCRSGTRQGQYCGYCSAVTAKGTGGSWEHVFECSPSGGCCDYGASSKCAGNNWDDWCPK